MNKYDIQKACDTLQESIKSTVNTKASGRGKNKIPASTVTVHAPLIKFFFPNIEKARANASMEVTWCIEDNLRQWLTENNIPNPHLILINLADGRFMSSKVIPLEQGSTFFNFYRGGDNKVISALCFSEKSARSIVKKYTNEDDLIGWGQKLDNNVFEGDISCYIGEVLDLHNEFHIDISTEMFAAEPNKHVKYFANLWYETQPRDQCQFRQRKMLLALKMWPLLIYAFVATLHRSLTAYWMTVSGYRDVDLAPILHPFTESAASITLNCRNGNNKMSIYNYDGSVNWWKVPLWLVHPAYWLCMFPALTSLFYVLISDIDWAGAALVTLGLTGFVAMVIGAGVGIALSISFLVNLRHANLRDKWYGFLVYDMSKLCELIEYWLFAETYDPVKSAQRLNKIVCPVEYNGNFKAPQPIRLRQYLTLSFERVKAKVCKPFAR